MFLRISLAVVMTAVFTFLAAPSYAQWEDDFESYSNGQVLDGVNGWQGWDGAIGAAGIASNAFANGGTNSIEVGPAVDAINELGNPTSGAWVFTIDQYIPTGLTGDTYFIMQNTYNDAGPYNWSIELLFSGVGGTGTLNNVTDDFDADFTGFPILFDQWVEIRIEIDLDNNTTTQYYGGQMIGDADQSWTERGSTGGAAAIGAIDLFSNGASAIYYDNAKLEVLLPDPVVVTPDTITTTRGTYVSGDTSTIAADDGADYSIRRSTSDIQSRTEFTVTGASPNESPTLFEITLNGSVFARSTVNQTIELFDYDAAAWEELDTSTAARFGDSTVTVAATGDLSRFVEAGTGNIEARVRFRSTNPRQQFTSNTDMFIWTIQ